uniref:Uncharacterized protein LOC104211610 n=1 Tax=Nicotiana sylvestris TaxID=4096 RepID=A0A1U7VAZ3_NICSY
YLDITDCSSIKILPDNLGDIKSLRYLYAYDTAIKQLPRSVEMLRNIVNFESGRSKARGQKEYIWKRSPSDTIFVANFCILFEPYILFLSLL